jgi:hypothetical protein
LKINKKYLFYLGIIFVLFYLSSLNNTTIINWDFSMHYRDKIPFGGYALNELLQTSWFDDYRHSYQSMYEWTPQWDEDLLVISSYFTIDKDEIEKLEEILAEGHNVLLAAHFFDPTLREKLNFTSTGENALNIDSLGVLPVEADLKNPKANERFISDNRVIGEYFTSYDTAHTEVLLSHKNGPLAIKMTADSIEGSLVLCSAPLLFSNYSLVMEDNNKLASGLLSHLTGTKLHWTEFYQVGRMESQSSLRYIMKEPALRNAFFATLFALLLLMIFDAKRKQRPIPVIEPLKNTTLEFVRVIGSLYYQKGDHRDLALKKFLYLQDYLKRYYYINFEQEEKLMEKIAAKTGVKQNRVEAIFDQYRYFLKVRQIDIEELRIFTERIEEFYKHKDDGPGQHIPK